VGDHREEPATVAAPARVDAPILQCLERDVQRLEPERYKVQFTATEEYVRLVEEAKALLSHAVRNVTLEELQIRAMRALVAELKKKKYSARGSSPARAPEPETAEVLLEQHAQPKDTLDQVTEQPHTRRRGRHIPAAVRRLVFEREGNRCSYLDANGARCTETHRLEFHHLKPFATGGDHVPSNVTLRCAAHNALPAEEDFGREFIEHKKNSLLHESLRSHSG
jgi:hypothetical protein